MIIQGKYDVKNWVKENIRFRLQTTEVRAKINTFDKICDINFMSSHNHFMMPVNFMLLHVKVIS